MKTLKISLSIPPDTLLLDWLPIPYKVHDTPRTLKQCRMNDVVRKLSIGQHPLPSPLPSCAPQHFLASPPLKARPKKNNITYADPHQVFAP